MDNNPILYNDPLGDKVDWWENDATGEAEYIDNKKVWDKAEMKDEGYSYLGEYQISEIPVEEHQ